MYRKLPILVQAVAFLCASIASAPVLAEHPGVTHTLLLKMKPTGAAEQVIVWDTEYAPGAVNPHHFHPAAVTFHVLSDTGVWQEDGKQPVTLHAGDSLFAPDGTVHTHWNPSSTETLRFIEFVVAQEGKEHSVARP